MLPISIRSVQNFSSHSYVPDISFYSLRVSLTSASRYLNRVDKHMFIRNP